MAAKLSLSCNRKQICTNFSITSRQVVLSLIWYNDRWNNLHTWCSTIFCDAVSNIITCTTTPASFPGKSCDWQELKHDCPSSCVLTAGRPSSSSSSLIHHLHLIHDLLPPDFANRCVKSLTVVLTRCLQVFCSAAAHFRQILPTDVWNP